MSLRLSAPAIRGLATVLLGPLLLAAALACAAQQPASVVKVDEVRWVAVTQTVPVIGRLISRRTGAVASRVDGTIDSIDVEVGDRVQKGQVLARVDTQRLAISRDLASGRLQELQAKIETARTSLALARQDRERLARLKQSQSTAKAQLDDARIREQVEQARVREAAAALVSADASLRLAELDLSDAQIKAPYPGVVTSRNAQAGEYVKVGDNLLHLVSDTELEVDAAVPSDRITGLSPGTTVRVTLDDHTEHSAVVRAVLPDENPMTRTRAVRLLPNFGPLVKPLASQQSVTIHVPIGPPREALSVHKDAVTKKGADTTVYVVENEAAQPRIIQVGAAIGSRLEVLSGLQAGARVVVRGNERLRPNEKVRIAPSAGQTEDKGNS